MERTAPHILVVDDEAGIRDMFSDTLEGQGYLCHTAESGDAALNILKTETVDLALVDIIMPGMTGLVLFSEIKERHPELPVIFVTAIDDLSLAVGHLKRGAYDYLLKPVKRDRLKQAIEDALDKNQTVMEVDQHRRSLEEQLASQVGDLQAKAREISSLNRIVQAELSQKFNVQEEIRNELRELWERGTEAPGHQLSGSFGLDTEEERRSLAAELHDDTMADLSSLVVELSLMKRQASATSPELEATLDEIRNRLKVTDQRLREIVQGIYPPVLAVRGLKRALHSWLDDYSSRAIENPYPLEIEFRTSGFDDDERLPEEVEIGLYRITQQGVLNAIQHAQARRLTVDLVWSDTEITLSLTDDGVGFNVNNPSEGPTTGHFGLVNLRDRVEKLQGTLEIQSRMSVGTTLRFRIPTSQRTHGASTVRQSNFVLRNSEYSEGYQTDR